MDKLIQRKKLIDLLPEFMKQFKEIQEIMKVEEKMLQGIEEQVEIILNNAFIERCDEDGIKEFEKILNITSSAEDTLEIRKAVVLSRWNNELPYTLRTLYNRLNVLCGNSGYMLDTSEMTDYHITCMLYDNAFLKQVEKLFNDMMPANIYYEIFHTASNQAVAYFKANIVDGEILTMKEMSLA